ncbi:MAG: M48 family metalloprotease [Alphaproteobacteria bacterium]
MIAMLAKAKRLLLFLGLTLLAIQHISVGNASELAHGSLAVDAEAEAVIQGWLDELAKAADLRGHKIRPYFLISDEANAGATVGSRVIIYTGLITKCQNVAQFLGVLAHEVGHIQGGHVALADSKSHRAQMPALAAIVLGGAATLATGDPSALMAGIIGSQHIYMSQMLRFSRSQEAASDQAAATLTKKLGWDEAISGLSDFLKLLKNDNLSGGQINPYLRSHPPEEERFSALETHISENRKHLPKQFEDNFQRIKAKFIAYLWHPNQALHRYPESDTSLTARYARVVIYHRQGNTDKSLALVRQLINEHPKDAYFHELEGQVLMETGQADGAIAAYSRALKLQPRADIIKLQLCHLLVDRGNQNDLKEAIPLLRQLIDRAENISCWRLLATAYGKAGQIGLASWALAEEAYDMEDFVSAKNHANRAAKQDLQDQRATSRVRDILAQVNEPKR